MADLTAADVTVILTQDDIDRSPDRVGIRTFPEMRFGNGVLKYPALGIPMPELGKFGMNFAIKRMYVEQPADGYIYSPDRANHKMRIFKSAEAIIDKWSMQNILGADADVSGSMTTDQAAGPTNDDRIDTFAAVAAGAWTYSENNEIDVPRNVCLTLYNDSGGTINMQEAALTATITGTFRGQAQTDVITETFTAGNKAIATTKFRWKYGVKPFEKITTVVITGLTASQNGLKIGIGLGRLLGVPVDTKDGVATDFIKVLKAGANAAVSAYSDTNKTLDLGAIADNDDFDIWQLTGAEMGNVPVPPTTLYLEVVGR